MDDVGREVPIVSIEDGMAEDDWAGWKTLTKSRRKDLEEKNSARRRRSFVTNTSDSRAASKKASPTQS